MKLFTLMITLAACLIVFGCSQEENKSAPAQSSTPTATEKPAAIKQAEQVVQQTKEKVAQVAEQAKEKVTQVTEQAQEKVAQVKTQAQGLIATAQNALSPDAGQKIYIKDCSSCHKLGLIGAPKIGDNAAWTTRLNNGMEPVVKNAIDGKGNMPAKGGNSGLSDDEIKAAVEYMVEQSK